MYIEFIAPAEGIPDLICEATLVFDRDDGPLDGLRLVGFSLWNRPSDDGMEVVFPHHDFDHDGKRYRLRFLQGASADEERLCTFVVEAYAQRQSAGDAGLVDRVLVRRLARAHAATPRRPAGPRTGCALHESWTCTACQRRQIRRGPRCHHCGASRPAH